MAEPIRVLVVGLGKMGACHARAYHRHPGFEIVGIMSRSIKSAAVPRELIGYRLYEDFDTALAELRPAAVSINSWPNTHVEYASKAMNAGAHVFMEKPIATTVEEAQYLAALALATNRKLVLGYILRVHPTWIKFIELGRTLGSPLVMRFSLNQQSNGPAWTWHKNLIDSLSPVVDSGVHYVDVMCQLTRAQPIRVHGIGAALWADAAKPSYGHLHVAFDDGSVGWYEAGWGPMMTGVADVVREVLGPEGAVSIVPHSAAEPKGHSPIRDGAVADVVQIHRGTVSPSDRTFVDRDAILTLADAPDQQQLCDREQAFFLRAINENIDLGASIDAAVSGLRVVLAAEQSMKEGRAIELA